MKITLKTAVVTGLIAATTLGGMATLTMPAEAAPRGWRYGHVGHPYGFGGRHWGWRRHNNGGAVAAGLISGLAIGALAASAAHPAYGYGYSYGHSSYYPAYDYGPGCYTVRRRYVDAWGGVMIRRVRVCE